MRKVWIGPFCSRLIGHTINIDNPVSLRWWSAHVVPSQTIRDDAADRNRALQVELRRRIRDAAQSDAHGRAAKKVRRQKG